MLYEEMAADRARRLRAEADEARRANGVVSVRRAERQVRRARSRLTIAKLRLAKVV